MLIGGVSYDKTSKLTYVDSFVHSRTVYFIRTDDPTSLCDDGQ